MDVKKFDSVSAFLHKYHQTILFILPSENFQKWYFWKDDKRNISTFLLFRIYFSTRIHSLILDLLGVSLYISLSIPSAFTNIFL